MSNRNVAIGKWLGAGAGLVVMSAAISCSAPRDAGERAPAPPPGNPVANASPVATAPVSQPIGAHWVQDQGLRVLMGELSRQNPRWPQGVAQEPEEAGDARAAEFDKVAALADGLMRSAEQLPDVARRINVSEADRRGFLAEAQVLHDQAERLRDAARRRRVEQMQVEMASLNSTCISCHNRFRDFSGKLNSPQARAEFRW